jgi:hypothetical protein
MLGTCECHNEPLGFVKGRAFLDWVTEHREKDCPHKVL